MGSPGRHTILCFSSQRWDDGMWTNKQHIMSRLARDHDVIHVNFGPRSLSRIVLDATKQKGPLSPIRPRAERRNGLTVLDFWAPNITKFLPHSSALRTLTDFDLRVELARRYMTKHRIESPIVWVYHPGYGPRPTSLPHSLVVYDCVDEYTAFPELRASREWMAERERKLCEAADVVFCTAPSLYETKKKFNPHTHLVHNVGDADHFKRALDPTLEVPSEIAGLPRPIIGFVGAVSDYKLNTDWILHLARQRPSWSIAIVGPVGLSDPSTDVSRLKAAPNVHLLGHRPYEVLPAYVKGFDVAVIPYRLNEYTRGVFPIKFFEFLASGRPVVISELPALREFYDTVLVASDADEFVERCQTALGDTEAARRSRIELASRHTWSDRVRKLMAHVDERLAEKESSRVGR